jgi:hypothetical protein
VRMPPAYARGEKNGISHSQKATPVQGQAASPGWEQ